LITTSLIFNIQTGSAYEKEGLLLYFDATSANVGDKYWESIDGSLMDRL
jgi:hypothetical protein